MVHIIPIVSFMRRGLWDCETTGERDEILKEEEIMIIRDKERNMRSYIKHEESIRI